LYDFVDASTPFPDITASERIHSRHQTRVFHHKCHEFCGIAPNAEKFQTIFLDEAFEGRVSGQPHSVSVTVFQCLA